MINIYQFEEANKKVIQEQEDEDELLEYDLRQALGELASLPLELLEDL